MNPDFPMVSLFLGITEQWTQSLTANRYKQSVAMCTTDIASNMQWCKWVDGVHSTEQSLAWHTCKMSWTLGLPYLSRKSSVYTLQGNFCDRIQDVASK